MVVMLMIMMMAAVVVVVGDSRYKYRYFFSPLIVMSSDMYVYRVLGRVITACIFMLSLPA